MSRVAFLDRYAASLPLPGESDETDGVTMIVDRFRGADHVWDAFGSSMPGWTAFHRYGWRSLIESLYGHDCPFLSAHDDTGALTGILPLVRVRSRLLGHYLVSMPFVSYGGPLGSDDAVRALASHAARMAEEDGARLLELRSAHRLPIALPVSHRKLTVVLSLDGGADAVFGRLKPKVRSQVRRPNKEGVTYRFGRECVDDFHAVFARHMRDLGTPAQPRSFFRAIANRFGDDAWFGCAYLNSQPIACGAGLRWNDEFEITWASSLREWNRISANMGLYWAFIERACAGGLSRFNFGRCTPGSPTHRYKQQWGARDEPLWWYQQSSQPEAGTPSQDSPHFALASRAWRHLPVGVATALGGRIVRFLP